jgi:hypothetical protein
LVPSIQPSAPDVDLTQLLPMLSKPSSNEGKFSSSEPISMHLSSIPFDGKDLDYFTHGCSQTEVQLSEIQIDEIYEKCQKSLNNADIQLKAMKEEFDKQASYLKMTFMNQTYFSIIFLFLFIKIYF